MRSLIVLFILSFSISCQANDVEERLYDLIGQNHDFGAKFDAHIEFARLHINGLSDLSQEDQGAALVDARQLLNDVLAMDDNVYRIGVVGRLLMEIDIEEVRLKMEADPSYMKNKLNKMPSIEGYIGLNKVEKIK